MQLIDFILFWIIYGLTFVLVQFLYVTLPFIVYFLIQSRLHHQLVKQEHHEYILHKNNNIIIVACNIVLLLLSVNIIEFRYFIKQIIASTTHNLALLSHLKMVEEYKNYLQLIPSFLGFIMLFIMHSLGQLIFFPGIVTKKHLYSFAFINLTALIAAIIVLFSGHCILEYLI